MDYNFREIEQRWQQQWIADHTYRCTEDPTRKKFYVLNMFPYPSGAGLHVGHPLGYIASDIYARYKRQQGFNVLNPMGYDAYGLPAEQYAIQTGQHPAITTDTNIRRYREQLDKIGFSFDWEREIRTCDPDYYHWTQWAFSRMFNSYYDNQKQKAQPICHLVGHFECEGSAGIDVAQTEPLEFTADQWRAMSDKQKQQTLMNYRLAYLGETMVNWCQELGTVLANDEVVEGVSVRGGYPVVQKKMRQWCLRVSAYAQRLLDGLDTIQWSDSIKETQRNWIGRSEGAEVEFKVKDQDWSFTIFTTRADTMFGVTFMVLAPESELVGKLTTEEQRAAVDEYLAYVKKRTELDRISDRKVTGVFSGSYAINPLTGDEVPIWISEYVLAGYGTGAIMAVPAHDSRDYAFARHFNLPIIPLIEGADVSEESYDAKEGIVCNSPRVAPSCLPLQGRFAASESNNEENLDEEKKPLVKMADPVFYTLLQNNAKKNRTEATQAEVVLWNAIRGNATGGHFRRQHVIGDYIADFASVKDALVVEIDGGYHNDAEQKELDRLRTEYLNLCGYRVIRFTNEQVIGDLTSVVEAIKKEIEKGNQSTQGASLPLQGGAGGGLFLNGLTVKEAIAKTKDYVSAQGIGRVKVNYRLRDAIFSRQRYWGEPFPVYYKDGMPQMIPEECLPLELPDIPEYRPTETGEPPLGRAALWAWDEKKKKVVDKQLIDNETVFPIELNTMPGFAGSSAYYLRYMDPHNPQALVSESADKYWQAVDLYVGGSEHATGHLIYSRFWNKFLFDLGVSCQEEPFQKLVNQGMIQGRSNFVYRIKDTNTFVSHGLKKNYDVTPIHVDVNIVSGDVLDTEAFRAWRPEYATAEFILEDGKYICGWAVEKMSKSMFNVVNPDMIVERYGADTLRLYEMFLGPVEQSKPWDTNGIDGCHRFLKKFWNLAQQADDSVATAENMKSLHKLIKKVSSDIEAFSFNTSVAAFMIAVGELSQQQCHSTEVLRTVAVLIAPFCPHIAEELWHQMGGEGTVCEAQWPSYDEKYLVENEVNLTVSFNGKARYQAQFPADAKPADIEKAVLADERSQRYLDGKTVVKVIVVPKKIVNIVIK